MSWLRMQYTYPDGANTGKISMQTNLTSGEVVQYQYDALGRMTRAETAGWSQGAPWGYSYTYDMYGNLGAKNVTQGSPSAGWFGSHDAANHLYGYNVENRLTAYMGSDAAEYYGYDPSNKRIQKQLADGSEEIHFYGARGER